MKQLCLLLVLLGLSLPAMAAENKEPAAAKTADAQTTASARAYPLTTCPVSDEKLGSMGEPVTRLIDGREVKFCCKSCVGKFEKEKVRFHKKMDRAIIELGKKDYPLDSCVVMGDKLGGDGDVINHVYQNQLVRLCCPECVDSFKKEPAKYLKQIDEARAAKAADKPADAAPAKLETKKQS